MKRWGVICIFVSIIWSGTLAAAKGPEVDLVDNKLSISAESIPLGRLMQLVDLATGMKSKVPPELANRNISVKFSGLGVNDAVRKMFQGQPIDYIVVQGQGVIITAPSQTSGGVGGGGLEQVPTYNSGAPIQQDQPYIQEFPQAPQVQTPFGAIPNPQIQQQQQMPQQPAMVQTPFGPIPNPRAQQAQPNTPLNTPGQNPLFPPSQGGFGQPFGQQQQQQQQAAPVFGAPNGNQQNPFGAQSPFGTPNTPTNNQNNNLFGAPPGFPPAPVPQQQQR